MSGAGSNSDASKCVTSLTVQSEVVPIRRPKTIKSFRMLTPYGISGCRGDEGLEVYGVADLQRRGVREVDGNGDALLKEDRDHSNGELHHAVLPEVNLHTPPGRLVGG